MDPSKKHQSFLTKGNECRSEYQKKKKRKNFVVHLVTQMFFW